MDGTSATFLMKLKERHPGTTERDLRQRSGPPGRGSQGVPAGARSGAAADEPAGLQPGFQQRCGHLGLGERGGHREQMPGNQGKGAGESQPFPRSIIPPKEKGKGEAALQNNSAIKGSSLPARLPA